MRKAAQDLPRKLSYSRTYRLASKHDFQSVFANPQKISRKSFVVLYRPNNLSHPRLGIVISKNNVKRAVDRNRLRRLVRESFRQQSHQLKALDIIVLLRSKCSPSGRETLREDIDNLWPLLRTP